MRLLARSAAILLVIAAAQAAAQPPPPCDQNIVVNPGCDEPLFGENIPGWTEAEGSAWTCRTADPPPHSGSAYFASDPGPTAELYQDVDLTPYDFVPLSGMLLSCAFRSADEAPPDLARIVFEFRDAAGTVLRTSDSGELSATGGWSHFVDHNEPFPGSTVLRVRLIGRRQSGATNDTYFDSVEVWPRCPTPVEAATWGRIKSTYR